jgi:hypothetical protein
MTPSEILWEGSPVLPPIGALVLIEHGRDEMDHICQVIGYDVKPSLEGNGAYHRVFVNVTYRGTATTNQRLLKDIKPLTSARSITGMQP